MSSVLRHIVFVAGLAALAWVGIGYVGTNVLALGVTALIAAVYIAGALDLHRFGQATASLADALAALPEPLPALQPWLAGVHPSLRNAVRRRVEGEPVGLPGPAMAPYLAGLLVLLGMLGTFVGMVLTLRGTGLALDSATDLAAVRASLVAPVKGLGLAFGTSVAGVATSAALGLLSALRRRDRLQAAQALDLRIATTLRAFSVAHQREESLKLAQRQAELMPALVDSVRAMTQALAREAEASNARLLERQDAFHGQAEAACTGLAASVDRALRESLSESARIAGATIRPVVEATLAGIARETAALHAALAGTAQGQVDSLSTRFEDVGRRVADTWDSALARLRDETVATLAAAARESAALQATTGATVTRQLEGVSARLDETARRVAESWQDNAERQVRAGADAARQTEQALVAAAGTFETHAASLLRSVEQAHAGLQSDAAARDAQRLAGFTTTLEAMATSLRDEWRQAGAHAFDQQQRLGETMERTAREITAEAATQARATIAEIGQLVVAASEAPRAAAEVIAQLRIQLSDGMARDNDLLDERARILVTLGTLLDGVTRAAGEQRGAIDALVGSSATLLERVEQRFGERVEAETGKLAAVAAQVTGSAVEVASLGASFGAAVAQFGDANDKVVAQLQRIDAALAKSLARSDEQLAYYVAQAREVVDLSILSQKQIIEELQRLASRAAREEATAR